MLTKSQNHGLSERLGDDQGKKAKLLKAHADFPLDSEFQFYQLNLVKHELAEDCTLKDEKCLEIPSQGTLEIEKEAWEHQNFKMVYSLRNVRRLFHSSREELVKYAVLEGTSVTLLGLVKYEADTDTVKMTHLATALSGGMQEIKRCFNERIDLFEASKREAIFLGLITLGIACMWAKRKLDKRRQNSQFF